MQPLLATRQKRGSLLSIILQVTTILSSLDATTPSDLPRSLLRMAQPGCSLLQMVSSPFAPLHLLCPDPNTSTNLQGLLCCAREPQAGGRLPKHLQTDGFLMKLPGKSCFHLLLSEVTSTSFSPVQINPTQLPGTNAKQCFIKSCFFLLAFLVTLFCGFPHTLNLSSNHWGDLRNLYT